MQQHKNKLAQFIKAEVKTIEKERKELVERRESDLENYKIVVNRLSKKDKISILQKENLKYLDLKLKGIKSEFENDFEELRLDYSDHKDKMKKWMSPERKSAIESYIFEGKKYYTDCDYLQNQICKFLNM